MDNEFYESHPERRPEYEYFVAKSNPFAWSESNRQEIKGSIGIGVATALVCLWVLDLSVTSVVAFGFLGGMLGGGIWYGIRQGTRQKQEAAWRMGFDQGWAQAKESDEASTR